jgi:hypothetical protein
VNFVLRASVFARGTNVELFQLVAAALAGRHRIEVHEDAEEAHAYWLSALDKVTREEADMARKWSDVENAIQPSGVSLYVEERRDSAWSTWTLSVPDAAELAGKPFRVVLENGTSDAAFLLAMMFAEEQRWFRDRIEKEWILLEHAGGIGDLKKRVDWAAEHPSRAIRAAAMFDGDAVERPATEPEVSSAFRARFYRASVEALDACERAQAGDIEAFPHHMLRRRAIENYLPIGALHRWAEAAAGAERRRRRRLVKALSRESFRPFFNMKKGHQGDRGRQPPPSWLPSEQGTPLEGGFGRDISRRFADARELELREDGGFDELRGFVEWLRRRIQ